MATNFVMMLANLRKKHKLKANIYQLLKISLQLHGSRVDGFGGFCFPSKVIQI